jgi:hypothetical protein
MTEGSDERAGRWVGLQRKLTYANTAATIAVFLALGGVGYAATDSLRALNRDEGRPLWSGRSYTVRKTFPLKPGTANTTASVFCDESDPAIGGGFQAPSQIAGFVWASYPDKGDEFSASARGWTVSSKTPQGGAVMTVLVRCADFADLHGQ